MSQNKYDIRNSILRKNQKTLDDLYFSSPNLLPFNDVEVDDIEGMRYMMGYERGWGEGSLPPDASESFAEGFADAVGDKIAWMLDGNYP